jgi:hypothetical protein
MIRKSFVEIAAEIDTTPEFLVEALLTKMEGASKANQILLYALFDQINSGLGFDTTVGASTAQAIQDVYWGVSAAIVQKALAKAGAKA